MASWAEPARRADGRCAREGCTNILRGRPKTKQKGVDQTLYDREPFCSALCARVYYGVEDAPLEPTCGNCGGSRDDLTPGCHNCHQRHKHRQRKTAA